MQISFFYRLHKSENGAAVKAGEAIFKMAFYEFGAWEEHRLWFSIAVVKQILALLFISGLMCLGFRFRWDWMFPHVLTVRRAVNPRTLL